MPLPASVQGQSLNPCHSNPTCREVFLPTEPAPGRLPGAERIRSQELRGQVGAVRTRSCWGGHPPPQEKGSSQMHQEGREEEGQPEIQAGANTHAHTVMPRFPLSRAAERVVS
ncbi:unnamed protein product [Lepidochelys kempii]